MKKTKKLFITMLLPITLTMSYRAYNAYRVRSTYRKSREGFISPRCVLTDTTHAIVHFSSLLFRRYSKGLYVLAIEGRIVLITVFISHFRRQ